MQFSYGFGALCLVALMGIGWFPATVFAVDLTEASRSVVKLFVTHQSWNMRQPWTKNQPYSSTCSGFYIEQGILTNAHCVTDSTYIQVEIPGIPDKLEAIRTAVDHQLDLALIQLKDPSAGPEMIPIKFDDLPLLREKVVTVGYPVGGRQVSYTEGVVSRISIMKYAYSKIKSVMVQTDAAINSGNSGGPVFSDKTGASLGVATQRNRGAANQGYFIPTPVIKQFLKDIEDGTVDGVPILGGFFQPLENPALRKSLGMKPEHSGGRLTALAEGNTIDGFMQLNDVLLSIDGNQVFNDGRVPFRGDSKIGLSYHIVLHQVGDEIKIEILREGKVIELSLTLTADNVYLIPSMPKFETKPRFFEKAGMIFRPVERRYIASLGKNVHAGIKKYVGITYGETELEELVVIGKVFDSSVNKGYRGYVENIRIYTINGHPINKLTDVEYGFNIDNGTPFHELVIGDNWRISLDKEQLAKEQAEIIERYEIGESFL